MKNAWHLFICALPLLLAGCGFSPVYATHNGAAAPQARFQQVTLGNIADRSGQMLRNMLMDRMYRSGLPADPAYTLEVDDIQEHILDLDITRTSDATRAEMRLITAMTLKDRATDKIILQRSLLAISSYNILSSQFTTRVSQENARREAVGSLAGQIENQLALYFARTP